MFAALPTYAWRIFYKYFVVIFGSKPILIELCPAACYIHYTAIQLGSFWRIKNILGKIIVLFLQLSPHLHQYKPIQSIYLWIPYRRATMHSCIL